MSIRKNGSGYALELVVGIQDEFNKQSKAITESAKKLEKEVKELQKTTSDVSQYEKSKSALERLEQQQLNVRNAIEKQKNALKKLKKESGETDEYKRQQKALQRLQKEERETTAQTREHERVIRRLKRSLGDAGLDVNNLSDDESKLKAKIDKTNQSIKEQTQQISKLSGAQDKMKTFGDKMSLFAGGAGVAGTLLYRGNDMLKNELLFSARTGMNLNDVQSTEQRNFRSELVRKYGATSGDIFSAQAIATQQGLGSQESMNLAASAIEMQEVFGDIDPQESIRAIANAAKGFNVSTTEAANVIFAIRQTAGDANGDLMDTFAEYAPLLGDKMSLKQYAASLTAGRKAGVWNYDKIGDSFKEAFQARFSDAGEFEKLVGGGSTTGAIEGIKNSELRKLIRSQAFKVRNALASGGDVGSAYAEFMQSLLPAMQLDPGAIKPIMEMAGGTIYSEDVGTKGVKSIADAMANPEKYLKNISLSDAALGVQTTAEKGINAGKAIQMGIDASTGKLIESQDMLATAINDLSGYISRGMGYNNVLGFAGGATEIGAGAVGTMLTWKMGKSILTRLFGGQMVSDVAANATKGGLTSAVTKGGLKSLKGAGRFAKGVPLLGTAINAIEIGSDVASGDDRGLWRDVGGIIGAAGGGALGLLLGPLGALVGGAGGSLAGEEVGDWLYSMFNDDTDVQRVERMVQQSPAALMQQPAVAQIEFVYSPQISVQSVGSSEEQNAALSASLVDALRNATPELMQQLKDTLEDAMTQSAYLKN
ncbi:phage tail tape measure protein [Vibrio mimicus]